MNTTSTACGKANRKNMPQGFSLIELLIVVAIILIIAAIAIPNLLNARISANEAGAGSVTRTMCTAEIVYAATYNVGYATYAQLGTPANPCAPTPANACLLDTVLSLGSKQGYNMTAVPGGVANSAFVAAAVPQSGRSGHRTFCVDETGVIRFDVNGGAAPANDAACEVFPRIQ